MGCHSKHDDANYLNQVLADLGDVAGLQEYSDEQLERLHHTWRYVALLRVRLTPAVIALMCGCVVGPFQSDTNYLTVTEQTLFDCVSRVHQEIFRLAGHPFAFACNSASSWTMISRSSLRRG